MFLVPSLRSFCQPFSRVSDNYRPCGTSRPAVHERYPSRCKAVDSCMSMGGGVRGKLCDPTCRVSVAFSPRACRYRVVVLSFNG